MGKVKAFICDIDGTVANHDGIRGHYEYDRVSRDTPHLHVINMVEAVLEKYASWRALFVSGRMDMNTGQVRTDTVDWLKKYFSASVMDDAWLFMRQEFLPGGKPDYRPDYIVKEEIYHRDIEPIYDV